MVATVKVVEVLVREDSSVLDLCTAAGLTCKSLVVMSSAPSEQVVAILRVSASRNTFG